MAEVVVRDAGSSALSKELAVQELVNKTIALHERGTPRNTKRSYQGDWDRFAAWCGGLGLSPLPASERTLVLYITQLAEDGRRASTIDRALSAIHYVHRVTNSPSSRSSEMVRDHLKRTKVAIKRPQQKAPPLLSEDVRRIVSQIPLDHVGLRDRALILLTWAGAFRRSEVAALKGSDVIWKKGELLIRVRSSKRDQEGVGAMIPIVRGTTTDCCPVTALRDWMNSVEIAADGHLFCQAPFGVLDTERAMPDWEIYKVVRRRSSVLADGDTLTERLFSAHSLRAGFITSAAVAGSPDWRIMEHSRHKSYDVFRGYIRNSDPFKKHPGEGLL